MIAAGEGAIIASGNTSALRGKASFAGFAPTKAAQRILAESIARELGPKGVHVAYVLIDAVIDLEWTRKRFAGCPRRLLHQARGDRRRNLARRASGSIRVVIQCRGQAVSRNLVTRTRVEEDAIMSQLRIFSYLPNPRIWKATIAARLNGVEVEVRGSSPKELATWLWDFDARPLLESEKITSGEVRGRVGFKGTLHKTDAFLEAHPFGTVPAAFSPDGKVGIFESNSIMRAVARLGDEQDPAVRRRSL